MLIRDVLDQKGKQVQTTPPNASLQDVVQQLCRFNIGSLLVRESPDGRVLGIITERDILRAQSSQQAPLRELRVAQFLSHKLITARPDDDIDAAMQLMTTHRVRHLPVIHEDELYGIVSIGDLVKSHHDELEMENHQMRNYIQGGAGSTVAPLTQ